LPAGTRLVLDDSVRRLDGGTLLAGGFPGRLLRLSAGGSEALATLLAGAAATGAQRRLGRRLVEAGMAHPMAAPDPGAVEGRVTVVVPVRDRSAMLDECLAAVGPGIPVVVVDDGSVEPDRVARVCRHHGARLVARPTTGGPAAARNEALALVGTALVAFVDSDCLPDPGWLGRVVPLFDDPELGGAAPRVRPPTGGRRALARFVAARSPLDMGVRGGLVGPDRQIRYVPTAALVVRRQALEDARAFDTGLRFGEDVDLVWRLVDAGWRVRYLPAATVTHREPTSWRGLLARRFRYGTSAGPLARRHPGRLAPVELRPWPTLAAAALLAGAPATATAVTLASARRLARRVRPLGVAPTTALRWSAQSTGWTVVGLGRAATVVAAPALVLVIGAGRRHRRLRRAALALALVPPAVEWWQRRPALDPVRWSAASLADDLAYGAGVWVGCWRARTLGPLLPRLIRDRRTATPDPTPETGPDPETGPGPGSASGDSATDPV
jgi:mycofactocin system glycosyltransferase